MIEKRDAVMHLAAGLVFVLASLVILSSILVFSAGEELIAIEYQKNYYIVINEEVGFIFKAYRVNNATLLLSFTYPNQNSYYLTVNGSCRSITTVDASFDLCLADIQDDYALISLDVQVGNVKIADPELVPMAVPTEPQNVASEQNLTAELQSLAGQIAELRMEIIHLNDTVYAYAEDVEALKTSGGSNLSVDLTPLSSKLDSLEARISQLESRQSGVDPSRVASLESKVQSLETQIKVLTQMVANLSKQKESNSVQMILNDMAERDPKLAAMMVAIDPSIPKNQKDQLILQLMAKMKEREAAAKFAFTITLVTMIGGGVGLLLLFLWLKARREAEE